MWKKIGLTSLALVGLVAVVLVGLVVTGLRSWDRTFEAPYPETRATADSSVIREGAYLAYGPAHCAYCHTQPDQMARIDAGEEPPLSGGFPFQLPFGTVYTPNLTPDSATGIGRRSDAELARILRYGVRADGRAAVPFMEFHQLSDADLQAVISFLRSQPAIRHDVPPHEFNLMGKMVMAYMIKPPTIDQVPPAVAPPSAPTIERGSYLANSVAACGACHTKRSMVDGSYLAPKYSGGNEMERDSDPSFVFVTPNLTPDPRTGVIAGWTEDEFIARFRQGKVIPDSHMPWGPFSRMSDTDLRAIYRYLMSLEPVENETGPVLRRKA